MENQTTNYDDQVTTLPDDVLVEEGGASGDGTSGGNHVTIVRICPRGQTRYTWRTTDTLDSVAARYGVKPEAIRAANKGVDFDHLNFGDEICVPMNNAACSTGELYEVRRGDTYSSIAAYYGIPVYTLSELNPYVDPTALQVGQLLCVPSDRPTAPIAPPDLPPVYPGDDSSSSGSGGNSGCTNCTIQPTQKVCPKGSRTIIMPLGWGYGTVLTRYNVSYNALQAANPDVDVSAIPAGQRLCIPPEGSRRLCADGTRSHVIDQGETLNTLAQRFGTTVSRLLKINAELAPSDFTAGRVICAPEVRTT